MNENELKKGTKIKIAVITVLVILTTLAGITYAFFSIGVTGNEEASSVTVTAALLRLSYSDNLSLGGSSIYPGWSQSKTISVENTGTDTVYYKILWRELLNQITNDELTISATCASSSGTCPAIEEQAISTYLSQTTNQTIKDKIGIAPNVTHTYTVTVTFKEMSSAQNYNQGKSFYGTLNIAEGTKQTIAFESVGTDSSTGFPVVRSIAVPTEEFYVISDTQNSGIDYPSLIDSQKSFNTNYGRTENQSNIYDASYNASSGSNYSIAYYVENYINALGVNAIGRLLTYTEYFEMTISKRTNGQKYWLGSAGAEVNKVWCSYSSIINNQEYSNVTNYNYNSSNYCGGVRPVLVVNTSDLSSSIFESNGIDTKTGFPIVTIGDEQFYVISDTSNGGINYNTLINTNGNIYGYDSNKSILLARYSLSPTTGLQTASTMQNDYWVAFSRSTYWLQSINLNFNYTSDKTILLARYNLYVGQTCTSDSSCTPISILDSKYGLQSEDAKGYRGDWNNQAIGVVPFIGSSSVYGYWDPSGSGIDSKYGTYTDGKNNIYDTTYITMPNYSVAFYNNVGNANYSVAYYVEEYINSLGVNATGRLLTYPEASVMTKNQRTNGQYYWLGSAGNGSYPFIAQSDGVNTYAAFPTASRLGVRPVVVVSTSDIQ